MKFSELVAFRNHLESVYKTDSIKAGLDRLKNDLTNVNDNTASNHFTETTNQLVGDLQNLYTSLSSNQKQFADLFNDINQQINIEGAKFFTVNYKLELKHNAVENIRKVRMMNLTDQTRDEILTRIRLHTTWRYPALEIGCRDGEWTQHMVAADPLYIVDHYREFTETAVENFNESYRSRIRVYLTEEHDLSPLPKGQFNFVFCWNILNFCSLDTVKEYLKEVKTLLRPGGTFMFSYNDGDTESGAGYAENFFMTYIPKSMLVPLCESLGYIITSSQTRDTNIHWMEIQLPGELKTVKAHQVMGEIKYINH